MKTLTLSRRLSSLSLLRLGLSLGLAATLANQSLAQTIPTQSNPGLLTPTPTNIPLSDQLKKQEQNILPQPEQSEVKLEIPEPPSIVELEGNQFHVKTIDVQGNTLIDDQALQPITSAFEGKDLTLNDLGKAVERINEQYRNHGYLTSIAYIPPQDISQGVVIIRVLEGQVGDISIAGNKFYKTNALARYLDQGSGDPLNISQLEKNLRRINRAGDFQVKATLSPNPIPGKTDIRLDVQERQPLQVSLLYDDQGRQTIGTQRWGTEFTNRNVSGIGDRFTARWIGAAGTQAALASYFVPLNRFGTELGSTFSFSRVNVDLSKRSNINNTIIGESYNYGLLLTQPLTRERTFVADAGLNFRRATSWIDGNRSSTQDDIRSLQFGLNFDRFDRWGHTFARAQTSVGMAWMGGNRQFWKAETILNRVIRLPKSNFLILRSYSQFTPNALPPAEQYQLGGAYSVRGYTEGLLVADRGYQFSLEHRWPIPGLKRVSPWLSDRVQGASFFDYGRVWMDSGNIRTPRPQGNETTLAGIGLGLRLRLTQYMQGFVDFGFPLMSRANLEPNLTQPTARVHFGVRSDLLSDAYKPWGKDRATRVNVKPRHKKAAKKIEAGKQNPAAANALKTNGAAKS